MRGARMAKKVTDTSSTRFIQNPLSHICTLDSKNGKTSNIIVFYIVLKN